MSISEDQWVWVVIQDPAGDERFLGQHDAEKDVSFIPVFLEKDAAKEGLSVLSRDSGHQYEVQSIRFDDLSARAAENGFVLFVLNEKGVVLEKIGTRPRSI